MGIVGFTNIFREPIMEIVGFTSNFHDCPNYGSGSRGFSIVGIVGFTNIFREPITEIVGFIPTISMIFQTSTLVHEISRYSWKLLELLVLPTFIFREPITEIVGFTLRCKHERVLSNKADSCLPMPLPSAHLSKASA